VLCDLNNVILKLRSTKVYDLENDLEKEEVKMDMKHTNKLSFLLMVTAVLCISILGSVSAVDTGNNTTTDNTTLNTTNTTGLADTPWPKYQGDNNNTGQSQYNGPQTNNTQTVTTNLTQICASSNAVIDANGTIYINNLNTLYAYNADGTLKWSTTTSFSGTTMRGMAIGSDGNLYVLAGLYLTAFNTTNGTIEWYISTGKINPYGITIANNTIYLAGSNALAAYSLNGTQIWTSTAKATTRPCSPAVGADGTIYVRSTTTLYAVNPADGTVKWNYTIATGYSSPVIGSDGTIYVAGTGMLYAFNPDGTSKWNATTGTGTPYSSAIAPDGTVYIHTYNNPTLYAVSSNGTVKWTNAASGSTVNTIIIGADGTVYSGGSGGVCAYNSDGTIKWKALNTGAPLALGSDGTLYATNLATSPNSLYLIKDVVPIAGFTADNTTGSAPLTVQFADNSTGAGSWLWDFGDGSNSTLQNPKHTYTAPGSYTVSLTVSNSAGNNTVTKTDYIVVSQDTTAPVVLNVTPTNGASDLPVNQVITVTFSEPISAGAAYDKIKVITPDNKAKVINKTINGNTLTIKSNYSYSYGDTYKLVIPVGSVTDLAGNNLTNVYNSNFTIGTIPTIVSVDPVDKAGNVSTSKTITVTFSNNVTAGTAYNKIKVITPNGQAKVISKTLNGSTLMITTAYSYAPGTYTVYIPVGAVVDVAGNSLASNYNSTFTVSPGPTVNTVNTTNISTNKTINVTFNGNIAAGSNFSKIKVITSDNKAKVATVTIKGNQLIITASYNYTPGSYTLSIPANSLTDSNGNAIAENYTKTVTI
jgi:PKD repeat protein